MRVPRPSPATAISILALFVALGGTSYAVTALPRDSVGSRQLRARAVKESELGNRSVITRKLAGQAVTNAKLAPGAVTGDRVAADALGGAQINESALSTVPFATEASRARTAERAALADRVEKADLAERATRADHATVADGLSHVDIRETPFVVPEGSGYFDDEAVIAPCREGLVPVSGGYRLAEDSDLPVLLGSSPVHGAWSLKLFDRFENGFTVHGTAYAICVSADEP